MGLLVVYNPVCGSSAGKQFTEEHVLPALKAAGRAPDAIHATESAGHAGVLVLDFLRARGEHSTTVLVASGDGTVHEIVNALHEEHNAGTFAVSFILVPVGTANALYASLFPPGAGQDTADPSYKLQSLRVFLSSASTPRPLTIATTTIAPTAPRAIGDAPPRVTVRSAVVTSTALHASILHDSERLRAEMPGVERFKVAAQENIARWYCASVALLPAPGASGAAPRVLQYDPAHKEFRPAAIAQSQDAQGNGGGRGALDGPFSYFLATTTVDRLEPSFEIAPLVARLPPAGPCLDLFVVRPARDPSFSGDTPAARAAFVQKIMPVLMGAYAQGSHVDLVYRPDGAVAPYDAAFQGAQVPVAECFRCGGWEWTPEGDDEAAHILCADGTIFHLERGETAQCIVSSGADATPALTVYGGAEL